MTNNLTITGARTFNDAITTADSLTTAARIIKRVSKSADYNATVDDYLIGVDTSTIAITITLPSASSTADQVFEIVDETGNSSQKNITVALQSGDTINGDDNLIINADYTAITMYSNGITAYFLK